MRRAPTAATGVPLHLTVDPWWETMTALAFGSVDDGLPADRYVPLPDDERIVFVLAGTRSEALGFRVSEPHAIDVDELDSATAWSRPRFDVPVLGLAQASVAEILLAVRGTFGEQEPTADAMHFHLAISATAGAEESGDYAAAISEWRLALEAGDMKALFGLGYTLVEAGMPREAYPRLRRYCELTPDNAWAWYWLGRACVGLGDRAEGRAALERALRCEAAGSFETDAATLLRDLG